MALKNYQTDYLLLLVGGNPLPVYISAVMLATAKTKVKLLYSKPNNGSRHTATLAAYLAEAIKKKLNCDVERFDIPSVGGRQITQRLQNLIRTFPHQATVGINYTGGTKQMVVYTLQLLQEKYGANLVQSYLNAQDKQMYIEQGNAYINPYPIQTGTSIQLDDLLFLHNYQRQEPLVTAPSYVTLSDALQRVHQSEAGIKAWFAWRRNEFAKEQQLPSIDNYPLLEPVINAMSEVCNGEPTPEKIAHYLNFDNGNFMSCVKWFKGEWLEEWVLGQVLAISGRLGLHSVGSGLKICQRDAPSQKIKGEIDVVAMKNYQLFVLSCIASGKNGGETKKHLFEAYTRARQLGGDEARVALVYVGDDAQTVQAEISQNWLASDAIVVFGRNELANFQDRLYYWFKRNS